MDRIEVKPFEASPELNMGDLEDNPLTINNIVITFIPAGHILGSSQILIEYNGHKVLISGDYKRVEDKTCKGYQNKKCDIFVTEATFGLPIFSHPSDKDEIKKLL